ncbi:relaxase/mobilization nuclease domain-containing protein, partial [Staphylococcus epidermidis]
DICVSHHLSIPNRQAQIRYTQAEKGIVFDREEYSWKDELRELIENTKTHTSNLETFSEHLEAKGVKVKVRGETISYKPENANKWVRGRTLGSDYEKGAIDDEHERHQEQQREPDYADGFKVNWDAIEQHTEQLKQRRIERAQKTKQANRKVFSRDRREPENERERTRSNHIKIERDDEGLSR